MDYPSVGWIFDLRITSSVFHLTILESKNWWFWCFAIIKIEGDSLDPVISRPLKNSSLHERTML